MNKLLASVSYSFNSFYGNLNSRGKIVFTIIVFLLVILCVLLFANFIIENIKSKKRIKDLKNKQEQIVQNIENEKKEEAKVKKIELDDGLYTNEKTEIEDIAERVEEALKNDEPISLTTFEELQEKTAIISIDELMKKAKELELINDQENTKVNYLEKYNLEPAEISTTISNVMNSDTSDVKEVKAFKVSQVISPVYGVKKQDDEEDL